MREIVYSKQFLKAAAKLPRDIQKRLDTLVSILAEDAFNPLLHSKLLTGNLAQVYSFRITREWRALFMVENDEVVRLLKVGHRKDIYR